MHIDPDRPIANGIVFDDLLGAPLSVRNTLAGRGMVFASEFRANDKTYGGTIVAPSWGAAERFASDRGLGETIIGKLWVACDG